MFAPLATQNLYLKFQQFLKKKKKKVLEFGSDHDFASFCMQGSSFRWKYPVNNSSNLETTINLTSCGGLTSTPLYFPAAFLHFSERELFIPQDQPLLPSNETIYIFSYGESKLQGVLCFFGLLGFLKRLFPCQFHYNSNTANIISKRLSPSLSFKLSKY